MDTRVLEGLVYEKDLDGLVHEKDWWEG